jgi:armadillo repeat-containing protein 8
MVLNAIAERLPLQNEDRPQENKLADIIFTPEYIGLFPRILSLSLSSRALQESVNLTASLISRLCTEESQKAALANCGALDALALKLASFVASQGFVLPNADDHLGESGALSAVPLPAPAGLRLSSIIRAIAVIIEPSTWRAEHFLSSPGIMTVFPKHSPLFSPSDIKKAPWGSTYLSGYAVPRQTPTNLIDKILPTVPQVQTKASSNFPPLGPPGSFNKRRPSYLETSSPEEEENAIIPWLFHVIREQAGMTRLMAARLVTVLFRAGLAKKQRLSMLSYLLVPILLRMFDKEYDMRDEDDPPYDGLIPTTLRLREEAPAVLATLVMDKEELQKHAVEGGAIKKLSQLLKETYNPLPDNPRSIWHPEGEQHLASGETSAQLQLGSPGIFPIVAHVVRYRENILGALAALAPDKDEYRKGICNNGVVSYIIDALKPRNVSPTEDFSSVKNTAVDGNPVPTILAACAAARMLTRSVSVLRTSLIDAGVAAPLFDLIKHPDVEVQIAATAVVCNLALDFSPMKEVQYGLFLSSQIIIIIIIIIIFCLFWY